MDHSGDAARVGAFLQNDNLPEAIRLAIETVRLNPQDSGARRLLIDLFIIEGDYERADKQADLLAKFSPELAPGIVMLRGRLRAASARQAWFEQGAAPCFPEGPTTRDQTAMLLGIALREKNTTEITRILADFSENSTTGPAWANGVAVDSIRDIDDRIPHALEILCGDGSYMWIDFALIQSVEFSPIRYPRNLIWREAKIALRSGSISEMTVPAQYYSSEMTATFKLGHATEWIELSGGAYEGRGQKMYLCGEDALDFTQFQTLTFTAA